MYGLTRATTTLIAAAVAGLLIWFASQIGNDDSGGYWARIGLVAGAGLVMALSQLLGGWTKWGWPRMSPPVFLIAFVPVAIVSLWVMFAADPGDSWFNNHVLEWTRDVNLNGLVDDMVDFIPVLAFGTGLVFGFSFDTTGPRRRVEAPPTTRRGLFRRRETVAPVSTVDRHDSDEPLTADRETVTTERPADRDTVTTTTRTDGDRRT